jgi:hypothetical protein
MNRDQAAALAQHLQNADRALGQAVNVIGNLAKEEGQELIGLLGEIFAILRPDLLAPIYDQYPDLRVDDSREVPRIDSELRWDQVRLPPRISEKDIDDILFSVMESHWRKVAFVVGRTGRHFEPLGLSHEIIAARLRELADTDQIEGAGDLRKWGRSEVRLKK